MTLCIGSRAKNPCELEQQAAIILGMRKEANKPQSGSLPLFQRARGFYDRTALVSEATTCSYRELLEWSSGLAELLGEAESLRGSRIAILVPPGIDYVIAQWAIWRVGAIAVPLALSHPEPELRYVLEDAEVHSVIVEADLRERIAETARDLGLEMLTASRTNGTDSELRGVEGADALILYTSGTTGRPKGVVISHENLQAQVESLTEAWGWSESDRILNVLPLHHTHGIVNILLCSLWNGACCEFLYPFDAEAVWHRLKSGELSLFMAVPTIYSRLIQHWDEQPPERGREWSARIARLRLMVSGSAALPVPVFKKWRRISGQALLERYGMTEIGMALSNPLDGERVPGTVGFPLPGVEVQLVDEELRQIGTPETAGQILVRGATVFKHYWKRRRETKEAFQDGWFQTGDVASFDEDGRFKILGRNSIDIIKTGGYKVSALEIENVFLGHPGIEQCAVVGVEDSKWGERVCAAIVGSDTLEAESLRDWAKEQLAPYKVPSRIRFCSELPRNAMGKVIKSEVKKAVFSSD